jgi:hypothetical protein
MLSEEDKQRIEAEEEFRAEVRRREIRPLDVFLAGFSIFMLWQKGCFSSLIGSR